MKSLVLGFQRWKQERIYSLNCHVGQSACPGPSFPHALSGNPGSVRTDASWARIRSFAVSSLSLYSRFLHANRRTRDILRNLIDIPQTREFQRPRAVAVGFFDIQQKSLKNLRPFVRIEDLEFDVFQLHAVDDFNPSVDPHSVAVSWNEKYQPYLRIAFQIAVAVKKLVAGHVGNKEALVIEDFHKSRPAAFWRGVTIALGVTRRHHTKRRLADKILDPWRHVRANLAFGAFDRVAELFLVFCAHRYFSRCRSL